MTTQSLSMYLPDSSIELSLCAAGVDESGLRQLQSVFLSLWRKMPEDDRRCIEKHWGEFPSGLFALTLEDPWFGDESAMARTEGGGRFVTFCWKTCRLLPHHVLEVILAHEMGHVYQAAIGKSRLDMTKDDLLGLIALLPLPLKENTLVEIHAEEMVMKWGLDPVLPLAFLHQHFDSPNGEHVRRKTARNEKRAYNRMKLLWRDSFYRLAGDALS